MILHRSLDDAVRRRPEHVAIEESDGTSITYAELGSLSDRLRDRLRCSGVVPGDRVGLWIHKSIDSVATIFGALKAGAAYVPVDPTAPASRNAYILQHCAVSAIVVERRFEAALRSELARYQARPTLLVIDDAGGGAALRAALDAAERTEPTAPLPSWSPASDELAYILYTSGSTGNPKGVMITHWNAVSFVEWCVEALEPTADDRMSSHAPFHFDLSIFDLHVTVRQAATVVLVGEELGKKPLELARWIADKQITVWYSAPSILSLIAQFGRLPERDHSTLRTVLFAGEVFPLTHLKSLLEQWPGPRYFNLYGPTETNVCTYFEVDASLAAARTESLPIGKVCSHLEGRIVDSDGQVAAPGQEGELCIRGPAVTSGYRDLPEQSAACFLKLDDGPGWYRTGDLVAEQADGDLRFLGRRDRMIKKRGYRVELGEIESCLYRHPDVGEAAVVACPDDTLGMLVRAHVAPRDGLKLSVIGLKQFCSTQVPVYMIPDVFKFHDALPKTSTDKVDYQALQASNRPEA